MKRPLERVSSKTPVVCPRCAAQYDRRAWLSLALLDRVDVVQVGWIEMRRCDSCEHVIAAAAEEGANDESELFPTEAAARHCGLSVSGLRQAARRGEVRPWTSSGLKLLWRRADLDRFLETRLRSQMVN
jgi:hypothetical protein